MPYFPKNHALFPKESLPRTLGMRNHWTPPAAGAGRSSLGRSSLFVPPCCFCCPTRISARWAYAPRLCGSVSTHLPAPGHLRLISMCVWAICTVCAINQYTSSRQSITTRKQGAYAHTTQNPNILAGTDLALKTELARLKLRRGLVDVHYVWDLFTLGAVAAGWGFLAALALAQVQALATAVNLAREAIAHGVDVPAVGAGLLRCATASFLVCVGR